MPPITSTQNRQAACQSENVPVTTAATANPYTTSAVASLTRLSPSMIAMILRGTEMREAIAVAATASVGATIAPTTNDTGHERPEMNVWQTAATVTVVTSTSPTASNESGLMLVRRSRSDVKNADE